jgi:hypothetical protein
MSDFLQILFFVNVAWMTTHELDAIKQHEWRIFPLTSVLPEQTGYLIFTALHVPLFTWILWAAEATRFQIGFDVFMILHAGLHWLFRQHPQYEFDNWFSQIIIWGGIPLGVLHLMLLQ